ncbi:MAG: UDP-N-acetylglucosamine 1-carboxyvinyltransferase [Candidatus Eisenbacteria bacterium]|nr:UDP-N-acetylglucosamine 1-carboxyvinyltransferase [Candidatus Latescibacterota bacterium]MBD3302975.1 UDP-N-acetylglucosamine 1-carboxyvinyltransferase [Candidatus Eisenbacteria bacterium]
MEGIEIQGGRRLAGEVRISGAKNAALPIMAASLLIPGPTRIHNVPRLHDVLTMLELLRLLGVAGDHEERSLKLDARDLVSTEAPYDLVRKMRASVYVLGPLLARFGRARVSLPGGCAWGPRPVDLHIKGMRQLGAKVDLEHGYIVARADQLKGARIPFEKSSVGATGNVMMAATLARGLTRIENAACEPEIVALADFLIAAGARIRGHGTKTIEIEGVDALHPTTFTNIPDRIETGTYLAAGAITGGEIICTGTRPDLLEIVLARFREMGCRVECEGDRIRLVQEGRLRAADVETAVYPGFPTDLQAQFMALLCVAEGIGVIHETIYPDRFTHVPELARLGAEISVHGNVATVRGSRSLQGSPVMSTDIRASSALILGGLVANGTTTVSRIYHIDRGYEAIEEKLSALGADIRRIEVDAPLR